MPFNFPTSPSVGQIYRPTNTVGYMWDGTTWELLPGQRTALTDNMVTNGGLYWSQEIPSGTIVTTPGSYVADQWGWSGAGWPSGTPATQIVADGGVRYLRMSKNTATGTPTDPWLNYCYQGIENVYFDQAWFGSASAKPLVLAFRARVTAGPFPYTFNAFMRSSDAAISIVQNFTVNDTNPTDFFWQIPAATTGVFGASQLACTIGFTAAGGPTYKTGTIGSWVSGNFVSGVGLTDLATSQYLDIGRIGLYVDPFNTGLPPTYQERNLVDELLRCKRYWRYNDTLLGSFINANNYWRSINQLYPAIAKVPSVSIVPGAVIHQWNIANVALVSVNGVGGTSAYMDLILNTNPSGTAQYWSNLPPGMIKMNARLI